MPVETNGRPTWRDLTVAVNSLREEMQAGFDRLESRIRWGTTTVRWGITTVIAIAAVGIAVVIGVMR